MSLSQAMSIALTGMRVSTELISLTSNNIANAQTAGFSSKKATLTSVQYGADPGGVSIASYSRVGDVLLSTNLKSATTQSSYYSTHYTNMQQVQTTLDSTSDNPALSDAIAKLAAAWNGYSSNPESAIEQQSVIDAGSRFAKAINQISGDISDLDRQIQQDIDGSVNTLNSALDTIATLNSQLQDAVTANLPAGDIQDKLDEQVRLVAGYTDVVVQSRANGQVALYTSSGLPLVDATNPSEFTFDGTSIFDRAGNDITTSLNGGSIQARVEFRDTSNSAASSTVAGVGVLQKMRDQLTTLVNAFVGGSSAFATAYTTAYNTSTAATGTQFGDNVASTFFTYSLDTNGNPDPATFAVRATLLDGTAVLPQMETDGIADSFDSTATYTTSGLTINSATYAELGTGIISSFQQTASTMKTQSESTSDLKDYYETKLVNLTGVNIDEELSNLLTYQNSYSANAHIISTISDMYKELLSIVG